jgi:predicted site-specific integrase-resolvase
MVIDGDLATTLWTAPEAAEAAGVSVDVIYQWKRRGKIQPVNTKGWPRYRALDILTAEAATRPRAGRRHAAA